MLSGEIVWLDAPAEQTTLRIAGGKGANLAAMVRKGIPVPPGFVVTTTAFRAFVDENELYGRIADCRQESHGDGAEAARRIIEEQPIPKNLENEILGGYRRLMTQCNGTGAHTRVSFTSKPDPACQRVAVRSSATAEDLPEASFAGGADTYLDVRGETALLTAVKRCWSSLWSVRAQSYLAHRHVDPAAVSLAVVVQQMVPADAAGILFTANPLTGSRDEMLINAAWGLGETVVGGKATPDTVVISKITRQVARLTVGEKSVMALSTPSGTAEVPVEAGRRSQPVLGAEHIAALADLGFTLESHFGAPQDIEWALTGDCLHVLQSRPITTGNESRQRTAARELTAPGDDAWPAIDERPPQDFDLWTQANVGEIWPDPVTPLVWSGVPSVVGTSTRYALRALKSTRIEDVQWAKRLYGRAYYNEGALAYVLAHEVGLPASFLDSAHGNRSNDRPQGSERSATAQLIRRLPLLLRVILSQLTSGRKLTALCALIDRRVADFMAASLAHLDDRELWNELNTWVDEFIHVMKVNTELSVASMATFSLLQDLAMRWCGRRDLAHELVAGLAGIQSAEMGGALWEIADRLSQAGLANVVLDNDPTLALQTLRRMPEARPAIDMLDRFLLQHGHHCANEGEWLHARWAEAPEQILEVLASYIRAGPGVDPVKAAAERSRRREQAVESAKTHLSTPRWAIFRLLLGRTWHLIRLRENGKNGYVRALYPVRRAYAEFGQRWFGRNWLAAPDDIFFLTMPEVERIIQSGSPSGAAIEPAALAAKRRVAFNYWFTVDAPEVVGHDGRPGPARSSVRSANYAQLNGMPVSGGVARGIARVVRDPADARLLQPGDVLVARAADPGWTPLFPLLAGLVVEIGGQLSHAAIVAREYGLPAVANIQHATHLLRTGQTVTVDGTTGQVFVEDEGQGRQS